MSFWSKLKSKVKAFGRNIDITYSKGTIGKFTSPIGKPLVQSTAVVLTGGTSLIFQSPQQRRDALKGFAGAAAVGGAIATGGALAGVASGAGFASRQYANSVRLASGSVQDGTVTTPNPTDPVPIESAGFLSGPAAVVGLILVTMLVLFGLGKGK